MYSSMDSEYLTRKRWPKMISQAFVDMPRQPETHIQKTAPVLPTPIVLAMAVQAAANPETDPWPLPWRWNILPKVLRK